MILKKDIISGGMDLIWTFISYETSMPWDEVGSICNSKCAGCKILILKRNYVISDYSSDTLLSSLSKHVQR